MVEHQGPGYLLLAAALGFAVVVDGQRAGDALVAAAAVAVDREGAAVHAGVGGRHGAGHNGVHQIPLGICHQNLARLQAIAFQPSVAAASLYFTVS